MLQRSQTGRAAGAAAAGALDTPTRGRACAFGSLYVPALGALFCVAAPNCAAARGVWVCESLGAAESHASEVAGRACMRTRPAGRGRAQPAAAGCVLASPGRAMQAPPARPSRLCVSALGPRLCRVPSPVRSTGLAACCAAGDGMAAPARRRQAKPGSLRRCHVLKFEKAPVSAGSVGRRRKLRQRGAGPRPCHCRRAHRERAPRSDDRRAAAGRPAAVGLVRGALGAVPGRHGAEGWARASLRAWCAAPRGARRRGCAPRSCGERQRASGRGAGQGALQGVAKHPSKGCAAAGGGALGF